MSKYRPVLAGTAALGACLALGLSAAPSAAGPCTEQLNEVSRMLGGESSAGATGKESGTLSGAVPGAIQNKALMPQTGTPDGAAQATADGVKGEAVATTMAGNAPGSQNKPVDPAQGRATSPQDVRLQQAGQPTAAQGGNPTQLSDRVAQARNELERARGLDAQGNGECAGAIAEAKRLMGS